MTTLYTLAAEMAPTSNLSLILAVVWTIKNNYIKFPTSSLTIAQYATTERARSYHADLIEAILLRTTQHQSGEGDAMLKFVLEDDSLITEADETAKAESDAQHADLSIEERKSIRYQEEKEKAIWFVDSYKAFELLEADILRTRKHYKRNAYFCLIYTGNEPERLKNMNLIFQRLFNLFVTNINVFMTMDNTAYVYTYFPFGAKKCYSSKPELYISFRGISERKPFVLKKPFFPHKALNMHGCVLNVATIALPPYTILEHNNATGKVERLLGVEGLLLALLAERMNFTAVIFDPKVRGKIFDNGTATGASAMVIDGKANLTIACYMIESKRSEFMQASDSYLSVPLIFAIPRGKSMSPFQRLIKPFKFIIWSCLSSTLLFGISVIFFVKLLHKTHITHFIFGSQNQLPFTSLWNTFYGGSIPSHLPRRNFARYLLAVWLLYSLVVRNAYSGELYLILQDGRSRTTLQSIREVVEQQYIIYTQPALTQVLNETLPMQNIRYMDGRKETNVFYLLSMLRSDEARFVLTVLEPTMRVYNQLPANRNRPVSILPDPLLVVPITIYMRRNSYLMHGVNTLLLNMMSSGMVRKFEKLYIHRSSSRSAEDQEPIKISLWLLLGLFAVYFILLLFCLLIFLLEMWSRHSRTVRRALNFFNC